MIKYFTAIVPNKYKDHVPQFIRFCMVGVLNAIIDFSVLNILSFTTKIYHGPWIILFNTISFIIAVTNSYIVNQRWTFRHNNPKSKTQFGKFILVNIGGTLINSAIVFIITTYVSGSTHHPETWLNIAKILALLPSTFWNFFGTKHFVFHKKTENLIESSEKNTA